MPPKNAARKSPVARRADARRPPPRLPGSLRDALRGVHSTGLPRWLTARSLPVIPVQRRRLSAAEVSAVLTALQEPPEEATPAAAALITQLQAHLPQAALDAFARRLFERWEHAGAPDEDAWVLSALTWIGGDQCAKHLSTRLTQWARKGLHERLLAGIRCLREVPTEKALVELSLLGGRLKLTEGRELIRQIAPDELLADRQVPGFGLDANGCRVLDFGPRQFRCTVGADWIPVLRDANGRVREELPAPSAADHPRKAKAAITQWEHFKSNVGETLQAEALRLEEAMLSGRRWTQREIGTLARHPLMGTLLKAVVLSSQDATGRLVLTFRVTEDLSFADEHDQSVLLPQGHEIGVAHPALLTSATRSAWAALMTDYKIVPPFPQIHRETPALDAGEWPQTSINRLRGTLIPEEVFDDTLVRHRFVHDGHPAYYKYFAGAHQTVQIGHMVLLLQSSRKVAINEICFLRGQPGWSSSHYLSLKEVDPIVVSEALRLAEALRAHAP